MIPKEISFLLDEAENLGNHYRKNIQNVQRIFPVMQESLSRFEILDRISLTRPANNYLKDMNYLTHLPVDRRTTLNFLGCYYTIQLLWFNISNLDWLDFQLSRKSPHHKIYKKFILNSGIKFRKLTAAYMHHLLMLLKEDRFIPNFVITGVGTRSDQDDIDVGIIDGGTKGRQWLNQVIDRMGVEMMRFATNFHFHLSEHVGNQAYSASIPEYENLLKNKIGNFVILTEMLGAALIIGDPQLFGKYLRRVTDRYYYNGKPNRHHEGYLRGILGEIIDLSSAPVDPCYIHPKHDGLRIIKNLIYAYKTRLKIREVNPWRILQEIQRIYPAFKKEFLILERSLSFLEIFRYLYQQLVVQDELILISDEYIRENLQRVASRLHYRDFGPHLAVHQLLQGYTEAVRDFRKVLPVFISDLSHHLQEVTVFRKMILRRKFPQGSFSSLLDGLNFFQAVHFWDDFFSFLQEPFHHFRSKLMEDLVRMIPQNQVTMFKTLTDWAGNYPEFIFKFCLVFDQQFPFEDGYQLNNLMFFYLDHHKNDPDFLQNLISLFQRDPALICRIMQLCNARTLRLLNGIVFQKSLSGRRSIYQKNLAELLELINKSSYYFKRFITNVYHDFPGFACYIQNSESFEKESQKILKHFPFVTSVDEKKKMLGTYYDLKFLHIGLETFKGENVQKINFHYTNFVNRYMQDLFKICLQQALKNYRISPKTAKHLAIYACGGCGREQAFDDDLDLIVILDSKDEQEIHLYREVMALMNTEMIKRGTLPHFRFSQYFGEYFCSFHELRELLLTEQTECFVDKSQLLESRLIIGTSALNEIFLSEIIQQIIFAKPQLYIEQMIQEIQRRHGSTTFFREKCANIKECTGGLRDIEMIILIYKVLYRLLDTNPYHLIEKSCIINSDLRDVWQCIRKALIFLLRFRYVYRLSTTAEDHIYADDLEIVAAKLNPDLSSDYHASEWLWQQFIHHRKVAWSSIRKLIRLLD